MVKTHNRLMLSLLRLGDLGAALAAWAAAYALHALGGRIGWLSPPAHSLYDLRTPIIFSLVLCTAVFSRLGLYEPKRIRSLTGEAVTVLHAVLIAWAVTYVIASFTSLAGLSRATVGLVMPNWAVLAVLNRLTGRAVLRWFRRRGWNLRYAAIVGSGRLAQRLLHVLAQNRWTGIETCYFIDSPAPSRRLLGLDVVGPTDEVDTILAHRPVDIVFVALPGSRHDQIEQVLNRLAMTSADVQVVPDLLSFHFLRHEVSQLADLPVVTLTHSPQHGWNSVMKRAFDLAGAMVGVLIFAVPMIVLAVLIKLTSRGPIFYRQERTSLGGTPFTIIKFRTMVPDAEAKTGPVWADEPDARVTRLGRLLRRTNLDELPQLLNVLLGHMSLVGPRPERPELIERFRQRVPRYMLRNQVKAGLTGWAQVHGLRGQTPLRKRVQYDLYYIANWSFGLDLRILFMSLFRA